MKHIMEGAKQGITFYLHYGDQEIAEMDETGQILTYYVLGAGVDQRTAMIKNTGTCRGVFLARQADCFYYYHANRLGNVIAISHKGEVADQYLYSPFGIEEPLTASGNPFRYTGQRYDPESGYFYYKARYYDPVLGRFLQTDPIGYADQYNLYAYARNEPLNQVDPSGMETCNTGSRIKGRNALGCKSVGRYEYDQYDGDAQSAQSGTISDDGGAYYEQFVQTDPNNGGADASYDALAFFALPSGGALVGRVTKYGRPIFVRVAGAVGFRTGVSKNAQFASQALLNGHATKHAADFGLRGATAYRQAASRFLTGTPGRNVLQKTRPHNGDIVRFNPKTNEFGVIRSDGVIRTYYKPDPAKHGHKTNLDYYNAQ